MTAVPLAGGIATAIGGAIGGGGFQLKPSAESGAAALALAFALGVGVTAFLTYQVVKA